MLLAIDIGNTNISLGVFNGRRLVKRLTISTQAKNYAPQLKKIFRRHKITDAIICSVVGRASQVLQKDLTRLLGKSPYYIGKGTSVPLKNLYRKPRQVGQDRLVNAYAAASLYGVPAVIVDFGTAITFDVVTKHKEYLGGMILPGLSLSLQALAQRTALLPDVKLGKPKEFIGRDTKSSMLSGIVFGFAALTDCLAQKLKSVLGKKIKVIGTGGNIGLMARYCRCFDIINPDLTLKGLRLLYPIRNV